VTYPAKLQGREIKNMHRPFERLIAARRPPLVNRSRRASTGAAAVAVALLTAAVACSSGTNSATATPASTATSNGTAAPAPDGAKEQAYLAQYEQAPTRIGDSTPFPSAPPKGKTFVYLQCDIPQCQLEAEGVQAASAALGWRFKSVPYQLASPASLVAAMNTALQYHPVAVSFAGLPEAVWQSEVPVYAAAHVALIPSSVGPTQPSPVIAGSIGTSADGQLQGRILAAWFITSSGGHGHALLANVPGVAVLNAVGTEFQALVAQNCPGCSVTAIQVSVPQFSTDGGVSAAVSALQKDPSMKYLITEQGDTDQGLPAALSGAGLSGIQIAGAYPSTTAIGYLRDGTAAGFVNIPRLGLGWMEVDIAALYSLGIAPATAGLIPVQFLTPSTVTATSANAELPSDYQSQYKALWHVG
jgi:ribose transport system substrate-binding protein